jgi:signal peptidase I
MAKKKHENKPNTERQDESAQKNKSKAQNLIKSFFYVAIIVLLLRTFVVQAYEIPSGSMKDTLLEGDFLLAAKFLYGIKIPYSDISIGGWLVPKRQKITIFQFPLDKDKDFVKRCIALPGDTLVIKDRVVYVNSKQLIEPYLRFADPVIRDRDFAKNMPHYRLHQGEYAFVIRSEMSKDLTVKIVSPRGFPPGVQDDYESCAIAISDQEIEMKDNHIYVDGMEITPHKVFTYKEIFSLGNWPIIRDNLGPYVVPKDCYFMMGDNRDESLDSRYWGSVNKKFVFGEPLIIYMSWLLPKIDPSYGSLDIVHRVRWDRLGIIVRTQDRFDKTALEKKK